MAQILGKWQGWKSGGGLENVRFCEN
jgi:hypothetical protein